MEKTIPDKWREIKKNRIAITIPEFLEVTEWSRSKYYRHRSKLKRVDGYGQEKIPIDEVRRVLGEEVGEVS